MDLSFEKVAAYLDTFDEGDSNYDFACYIKEKIANAVNPPGDPADPTGQGETESTQLENPEVDKSQQNIEGVQMHEAFKDLEVMNMVESQDKNRLNTVLKKKSAVRDLIDKIQKK